MDSPIRKFQKKKEYEKHKVLRKIKRKRKNELEKQSNYSEKMLRKLQKPKIH